MKVAIVGATGLVGREIIKVLEERKFPVSHIIPVASERSSGEEIEFNGKRTAVMMLEEAIAQKPDLALFSAGAEISMEWAPKFEECGCIVIDNSSAWRMDETKKLIVPEVNAHELDSGDHIISNPNCSTIQLVMVLNPLHKQYGVKRVIVSTYQSVTGTGVKAMVQMNNERTGEKGEMAYPYKIDQNVIPHCDVFQENGYTKEEMKLINETAKILNDDSVKVSATAVRVPVMGGHSESVNIELEHAFTLEEVRQLLSETPGVKLQDNPDVNLYPMPAFTRGKDEVFVGRIRRDESHPQALNLWIVADNLRKGAATNAVQIAEVLCEKGLLANIE